MSRRIGSIGVNYFDALYATDADPWRFATSLYERDKYASSLAALPPGNYASALEVGCSIGIFTRMLAARCGSVLSIDIAEAALFQARINCPCPAVTFERRIVPSEWPAGQFDLMVFSEVLYYLDADDIDRTAAIARGALPPGGVALLVHYLGETDYPLSGDEATERFIAASGLPVRHASRTAEFRIDVLARPF